MLKDQYVDTFCYFNVVLNFQSKCHFQKGLIKAIETCDTLHDKNGNTAEHSNCN
jgi:hypothetical protein